MTEQIQVGDIIVDVIFKDIKNVHLSVHPPTGRVRISAPKWMKLDSLRVFAISKINWIKAHQKKYHEQLRETPREFIDRESHYIWGRRYLLKVLEENKSPGVEIRQRQMILTIRPGSTSAKREAIVSAWYRDELRRMMRPLFEKWENQLGVKSNNVIVRRMKTRWGSCNPRSRNIHLNSELAKKPRECLEYVVAHELIHLLEPSHNSRFISLMDMAMPNWRHLRDELNRAPLGHIEWDF